LKIAGAFTILRAVTNPLKNKYLKRLAWSVTAALVGACGGGHKTEPGPATTAPLPTAGLAAQQVGVLPFTLVAADESLHWEGHLADRRAALGKADSILVTLLQARAPEAVWVSPDELRRVARRAPGIAANPDQMGTAILLHGTKQQPEVVPDPLRGQLRTLAALAGGGRYALVPAGLVFRRTVGPGVVGARHAVPLQSGTPLPIATAELTVVMVDVRTGRVGFRTVARGEGDDPWTALTRAVKSLTPGLP